MNFPRALLISFCLTAAAANLLVAKTLKVGPNGYATLQAAHDAAAVGDTIVITDDTPGANIKKRLTIQGTGGASVGCVSTAPPVCDSFGQPGSPVHTAGLVLWAGASGSLIRNVTIGANSIVPTGPNFGIVTGGTIGCATLPSSCFEAASNITIRQSTILDTYQGISGTCGHLKSFDTSTPVCPLNWIVTQNDISLNDATTTPLFAYIGITPFDGANGWNINHNVITRPPTDAPCLAGICGGSFTGIAGIGVIATNTNLSGTITNQNKVTVQGNCAGFGACGIPVVVEACVGNNDTSTVAYNDFRGSDFRTTLYAFLDPNTTGADLTGLKQGDWGGACGSGVITSLTVMGNLSNFDPNRGSVSGSAVSPSAVLPHAY